MPKYSYEFKKKLLYHISMEKAKRLFIKKYGIASSHPL